MRPTLRVLAWPGLGARSVNPYTWLLYSHLIRRGVRVRDFTIARALLGGYDILHVHWPEKALNARSSLGGAARGIAAIAILAAARLHGARLVWTAHNATPHDSRRPRLDRWFWSAFTRRVDAVIHLSLAGRRQVESRYPRLRSRPCALIPHGHYRGAYPDTMSRAQARASLGLPERARIMVFFGTVRPYKNVPHLVRTFRALPPTKSDEMLLVVGAPRTRALGREVRRAAGRDPRVRLSLGHVPDEEVQRYLRAADLVVLPFSEITNSGSALLALSFDRPVLVPSYGAMAELQALAGPDWVRTYSAELTPRVLDEALQWAHHRPAGAAPRLDPLEWPLIAGQTLTAYAGVLRELRVPRLAGHAQYG